MTETAKPIVWAFCNGRYPWGDEAWCAMTDDGQVITGHISSSRGWGVQDVGPERKHQQYLDVVGTADVDYRVVADGEELPQYVLDAHRRRCDESEAAS